MGFGPEPIKPPLIIVKTKCKIRIMCTVLAQAYIIPTTPNALPRSPFLRADLTPIIEIIKPDKNERMLAI